MRISEIANEGKNFLGFSSFGNLGNRIVSVIPQSRNRTILAAVLAMSFIESVAAGHCENEHQVCINNCQMHGLADDGPGCVIGCWAALILCKLLGG